MADNKIRVVITNKQKTVKIPTGIRMLVRRCCNAVLQLEKFEGPAEISVTFTDNKGIENLTSSTVTRTSKRMCFLSRWEKTACMTPIWKRVRKF